MTDDPVDTAIDTRRTDDWGALINWLEENILDDTPLSSVFVARMEAEAEIVDRNQLDDSAVLYTWCSKRKRLVPSH